ncbi:EF-hand domain-containing protein, partial [Haematococcus lacustris]
MDLIASVRHHQKSRAALRWFALFSGLLDLGEGLDSPQHLSFYLFTMQQLAYPASLTALFPGEGEEAARVRVNGVVLPDVCKAVFRYLNQPESCAAFMAQYGLVGLAEASLMDLIASVRHHQKSRAALRWFALFSGLLDLGEGLDSPQHLSFYLFTMQQLAYPASLTALFPGEGEEAARVRVNGVVLPDVCKAVFRYLNQPESCAAFMAQCVDPLLERLVTKLYSEAMRLLPPGVYLMSQ